MHAHVCLRVPEASGGSTTTSQHVGHRCRRGQGREKAMCAHSADHDSAHDHFIAIEPKFFCSIVAQEIG